MKWSQVDDKETGERRVIPFTFTVFSADQVDGWEPPASTPRDTPERIDAADAFISGLGADVRHGGNAAAYSPKGDFIVLPKIEQFEILHQRP